VSYQDILAASDPVLRKPCKVLYFNTNQMNMLPRSKEIIDELWNSAFCYDCFEKSEDPTKPLKPSNSSLEFHQNYYQKYVDCINLKKPDLDKNMTVCEKCGKNYTDLNGFYERISKEKKGAVCFDITDLVSTNF
jgi:hypothetical protein